MAKETVSDEEEAKNVAGYQGHDPHFWEKFLADVCDVSFDHCKPAAEERIRNGAKCIKHALTAAWWSGKHNVGLEYD